ncbi:uncharacterized protein V1518DRAFT_214163 [Limtongia smithiae]|uniref:uncharacterized protein n=1 Tax=Limtongia smithiae TaxID=1125753 RepID=UPI0034CD36CC
MNSSKEDLVLGIVDFLQTSIADKTVSADDAESVEVAIQCLTDVFGVDPARKQTVFPKQTLLTVFQAYEKVRDAQAAKAAPSASASPKPAEQVITEEDKARAEALKAEGNRYVAARDYAAAVDAYTSAIAVDPTNKIYYSNRAAAYSASGKHDMAILDAEKALSIDIKYAKAYSRLGLAKFASGDPEGAMEAYEKGMEVEGNGGSDVMRKGYETAKARVEEDLRAAVPEDTESPLTTSTPRGAPGAGGAGGFPDLSSLAGMFGGGAGGGAGGMDFASLMNNPQIAQMAQQFMSNPGALQGLMNNPSLRSMADQMRGGSMPSMQDIMNDPSLADLARNIMGGSNNEEGN